MIFRCILNSFIYAKIKYRITGNNVYLLNYYRRKGTTIGNNCHIYSIITTPEPYLISIGNNVTISTNVQFITHDNSVCKVLPEYTDVFGEINIGDNCFIGSNSLILPGVTLGPSTIVAAGSVVTKSFEGNVVIGGNPARIISDSYSYAKKMLAKAINTDGLNYTEKKKLLTSTTKLVVK